MRKKIIKTLILTIISILLISSVSFANSVEYRGDPEGLISSPDDFFSNFGELMPGDVVEDYAYIKNSTNEEIEVFFTTEPLDETEYFNEIDYSLLEKIKLKITLQRANSDEAELIYEGNLGAEVIDDYISLGKYEKDYDGKFIFKIEVPKELRNSFTLSETKVKWVFAITKDEIPPVKPKPPKEEEPEEDPKEDPKKDPEDEPKEENPKDKPQDEPQNEPQSEPQSEPGNDTKEKKKQENNSIINAQTSDNIIYIGIICAIVIILLIVVCVIENRRKKDDKEN